MCPIVCYVWWSCFSLREMKTRALSIGNTHRTWRPQISSFCDTEDIARRTTFHHKLWNRKIGAHLLRKFGQEHLRCRNTLTRAALWKMSIVRSTRECRNVRSVITYIYKSVQVRFLKNLQFWKIESSVISHFDRRIRNYLGNYCRNDAKQPIHLLTRLIQAIVCEKLPFP